MSSFSLEDRLHAGGSPLNVDAVSEVFCNDCTVKLVS